MPGAIVAGGDLTATAPAAAASIPAPAASPTGAYRWYAVGILALVYALNIADRYVVSTVMEPIRLELHLTDSGIAVLTGVSLALFYVAAGIPISAFADRGNRRNLITVAIAAWSALTLLSGVARTFWQLLAARVGVGVGEAGGTPPSTSLIADTFAPGERATACTFYTLGAPIGAWLGADIAGRIADLYGWRSAFFALGIPGIATAVLIWLTMREPRRGAMDAAPAAAEGEGDGPPVPLAEALRFIWRQRAAMHLMLAGAITALWGWGLIWWLPTYLMRAYGMTAGGAGSLLGPMHLVAGSLATIATGRIMASRAMANPHNVLWLMAALIGLSTVPSIVAVATHDLTIATWCLWLFVPALYLYIGPSFGLLQNVIPPRMRATATAVTLLLANIANLVIAPQFVGAVSDLAGGRHGADAASLRLALLILAPTGLWAAYHYWAAIRGFAADRDRALAY